MNAPPLLVLTREDDANRFHAYILEILLGEGYPWFDTLDLGRATLTRGRLDAADVVIVASISLSTDDCELLLRYAREGGRLLLLRPPQALARAAGLEPFNSIRYEGQTILRSLRDRWLHVNAGCPLADGIAASTLQFHGNADLYTWPGDAADVVAHLAAFPEEPTTQVALLATPIGRGRLVLFTYDLATSTVLFHQGRREQSSTGPLADFDGDAMYKPNDLFTGFLDTRLKAIPQADVHQDLLVRLLDWLTEGQHPLPRLWYFPDAAPAVAFFNGDGDNMRAADLRNVIDQADRFGVPFTTYVMLDNYPVLEPVWEAELQARGHGFGQHAWAGPAPSLAQMRDQLRFELRSFRERYGHAPVSYRGHNVIWVGWTEMADYLAENGVRLDTDFLGGRFHREGYVNGSGLPVKFMDADGHVIDLYEQCTLSTDDGMLTDKTYLPAYAIEEAISISRRQLEAVVARYHTVYHPYFHPRSTSPDRLHTQPWLTAMLWYCRKLGVPCVQDEQWVRFNDARRDVRLERLHFDAAAARLEFALAAQQAIKGLTVVLPARLGGGAATDTLLDGTAVPPRVERWEGRHQLVLCADFDAGQTRQFNVSWR